MMYTKNPKGPEKVSSFTSKGEISVHLPVGVYGQDFAIEYIHLRLPEGVPREVASSLFWHAVDCNYLVPLER